MWIFLLEFTTTSSRVQDEFQKKSPISFHPRKVRQPMTVLTMHNWLRIGQSKSLYIPPGFCDTYDRQFNH